jgi:molecular chaperone DnaK
MPRTDKKEREKVDKMNQADSLIFTTENFLKDNGDKIPADKSKAIEQALQQLKDAHKAVTLAAIDTAVTNLNTALNTDVSTGRCRSAGCQCSRRCTVRL